MKEKINGKTFEFNCKLRTCVKIRGRFKKTYNEIIDQLDKMTEEELAIFLYVGIVFDEKNAMSEEEFINLVLDSDMGIGDLLDLVMKYAKRLQYPGLSEEELEKKLLEKKAEADKYQAQN